MQALILNACENLGVFTNLRDSAELGIGTTREVADGECREFTQHFHARLAENRDIADAYSYAYRRMSTEPDRNVKFRLLRLEPAWTLLRLMWFRLITLVCLVALTGAYSTRLARRYSAAQEKSMDLAGQLALISKQYETAEVRAVELSGETAGEAGRHSAE